MKKYLIVLTCLFLAFASCKKDEETKPTPTTPPTPPTTPTCEAPTELTASVNDYYNVILKWSGTSENYKISRNDSIISTVTDTVYNDLNLVPGTYLYKVKGVCESSESDFSEEISVVITGAPVAPCDVPTGLTATVSDDYNVNLIWSGTSSSYKICRNDSIISTVADTVYTDLNLAPGDYSYKVKGVCDSIESDYSEEFAVVINVPIEPCNAPTGLTATVSDDYNVNLSWEGTSLSYQVFRDDALIAEVTNNSCIDSNLAPGNYSYKVKGVCEDSESDFSEEATAVIISICDAPTNLTASVSDNNVALSWSGTSLRYKIYRDNILIGELAETAYTDFNLAPGNYSYKVKGICEYSESDFSEEATAIIEAPVEPCEAPTNFNAIVNDKDVIMSWMGNGLSYNVFRDDVLIASGVAATNYTDFNLEAGEYRYKVQSVCENGESDFSEDITVEIEDAVVNIYVGDYEGSADVDGTITVMQQSFPYTNTVNGLSMTITPTSEYDKVDVVLTYNGQNISSVGTVAGSIMTLPDQQFNNVVIPFTYMGMTLEMNVNFTVSDINTVINEESVITGSGLAVGTGTVEVPVIGTTVADLNFNIDFVFNRK